METQTPGEYDDSRIYTADVVTVDKTFRGTPRDTVVVRQLGGTVGSVTLEAGDYLDMHVGAEYRLFLTPPRSQQPGNAYWATGAIQGYWRIDGERAVPSVTTFSPSEISALGEAIADALRHGPSPNPPLDVVPLRVAPPRSALACRGSTVADALRAPAMQPNRATRSPQAPENSWGTRRTPWGADHDVQEHTA